MIEADTPAVVVDLDRLERNLERWQRHCDAVARPLALTAVSRRGRRP